MNVRIDRDEEAIRTLGRIAEGGVKVCVLVIAMF